MLRQPLERFGYRPLEQRLPHLLGIAAARRSGATRHLVLAAFVLAIAVGVFIPNQDRLARPVYLTTIGLLCLLPVAVRVAQRRFDLFEPIVIVSVGAFFIWFLRPLASIAYSDWSYGNHDIRPGFDGALLVVLVGLFALCAGYALSTGRRLARTLRPLPSAWDPDAVFAAVLVMLAGAGLLFALYVGKSGGLHSILSYFSSREQSQKQLAAASSAWLYLAPYVTIPAALICLTLHATARRRRYLLAGVALSLLALAITVPKGDRTYVIMIALPLYVLPYVRRRRRPSLVAAVVAVLIAVAGLNVMLVNRVANRRHGSIVATTARAMVHPDEQLKQFLIGPDISMFSSLALTYQIVPRQVAFEPGNELVSTVTLPVPGTLWRHKPHDGETNLFPILFPEVAAAQRAGFGPSIVGGFYIDSGFVGVFVYMFALGVALRVLFEYWRRQPDNAAVTLVYVACLPIIILLMRGSLADTAGRCVYLLGPYFVAFWIGRRALRRRQRPVIR